MSTYGRCQHTAVSRSRHCCSALSSISLTQHTATLTYGKCQHTANATSITKIIVLSTSFVPQHLRILIVFDSINHISIIVNDIYRMNHERKLPKGKTLHFIKLFCVIECVTRVNNRKSLPIDCLPVLIIEVSRLSNLSVVIFNHF